MPPRDGNGRDSAPLDARDAVPSLPTGTVTLLLSDIEGSTALLQRIGADQYAVALRNHRLALREAFARHGGVEVGSEGDSILVAFRRATEALTAAREGQIALAQGQLRVRMGIHTGEPLVTGDEYIGIDVHRCARIASAAHGGQVIVSEQTARLAGTDGMVDLGEHRLKDLARPERLFQLTVPGLTADFPLPRTLDAHRHQLPIQSTPLIGREKEIAEVTERLLRTDVRLLTLTGPAGAGKTRLGLQAAAELAEEFPDGICFVSLASISHPDLIASALADTLGVREAGGRSLTEVLVEELQAKRLLLLLDNFEQVVKAGPLIGQLLSAASGFKVLVTSRIPLHLRGEHEYGVPPLLLPTAAHPPEAAELTKFPATRLFVERAQAVRPDFEVTRENSAAIAEICRRLDGLPLAIELAAARIRILSPAAMLARLQTRLRLLTGGPRDLPARQQTLRDAIAWSYDLLDEREKVLFRRLAVFTGGGSLDAIERICGEDGVDGYEALDTLSALVEQSLLRQEEGLDGEPRFRMLETILEFARERLESSGEAEGLRARHSGFFLDLSETADPLLRSPEESRWIARLDCEHDNLRSVLGWAVDNSRIEIAARMVGALERFWMARAHLTEGRRWCEEIIPKMEGCAARTRARVLASAGTIARQQGNRDAARDYLQASLEITRSLGDRSAMAFVLTNLGAVAGEQGDFGRAAELLEESLLMLSDLGEQRLIGMVSNNLGVLAEVGGDTTRAYELYERSLSACEAAGDQGGAGLARSNLGLLAYDRGDSARAGELFRQCLRTARDTNHTYDAVHELVNLGLVEVAAGRMERAARLFAAGETHFDAIGAQPMDIARARFDEAIAAARARLGDAEWRRAWAEGTRMNLEEAIAHALQEDH